MLKHGRAAEAEQVYREDLKKWPENGWSLFGLARALKAQSRTAEAAPIFARWEKLWAGAEVKITSSCLCLPGE